jgi:competence protein ComEA
VNINTANLAQIDALPGIGPVIAQRIITWRSAHRGFSDVHELLEVKGIGPAKFKKLQSLVHIL